MVASLLVLFMRSASLFQPANVLLWPSEGQRSRRLPQKELGISRQDFLQAGKGEASAQRKVSAARFVESSLWVFFLALILRQAKLHSLLTITTTPHLPPELL